MSSCLFCLEQSTEDNRVVQFNSLKTTTKPCNCRFYTHVDCWMVYFLKKGGFECPICHAKVGSPIETRPEQNITLQSHNRIYTITVPVDTEQTIHIDIPPRNRILSRRCGQTSKGRIVTIILATLLIVGILVLLITHYNS